MISNDATFITEDKSGNIWIGTTEGASRFNGINFKNYSEANGLSKGTVYGIYCDRNNKIWFGIRGGGINIFNGFSFDSLTVTDGLPSAKVFSITEDKKGNYWFACGKGIAKYDGKKIFNYADDSLISGRTFFTTLVDDKDNIWFGGTPGNGVAKFNGDSFENIELPEEVKDDFIGSITQDKSGNLWFATDHGVLKYHDETFTLFTEKEGLSVNGTLSVLSDYEGNIWIGTQGGGVNFFNNEAFVNYTEKDGLSSRNVSCIIQDKASGIYYIGTPGTGLNTFNPNSLTKFETLNEIKEIQGLNIFTLSIDKKGLLWIGAQEGVYVLEKKAGNYILKTKYAEINGHEIQSVQRIIQDRNGSYWIACYGSGVILLKDDDDKYYSTENGFASDNILAIFEDSKSNIWIGTQDAGLIKFDGEKFETITDFPDKSVWAITENEKGTLFFGTAEKGLAILENNNVKMLTVESGVISDFISVLQWDNSDNSLWLGAEKGVSKIKFNANNEVESIRNFREQEGFQAFGINQNAILIDNGGLVWMGSVNGLCRYDRDYDLPNITPPKIQLTGIRLAYQKVDWKKYTDSVDTKTNLPHNLELSYKNNHLLFDFQALTIDDVEYTYILEGQDDEWSPLAKNTVANYPNINPGNKYTFKVKSRNSHGVWNDEPVSFTFTINPPWWQTWWARVGALVLIISAITIFIKGRERVLKEQNLKLEKTVTERTAEVVAQKEVIIIEKKRSDDLLLNILPEEVADELKEKGYAEAKQFENVTVLFTDFKGFTAISERLTPQELVKEIDECFRAFDAIIEKYGIEKIKTIGDAYMAAGGLPVPDNNNAVKVVRAALEIRDYMVLLKKEKGELGFEIRIGIHTGSVVAGIVGSKKFAYDIWGDTVNTASRMESSGEVGKVNISQSTYKLTKEFFNFNSRGKISAKGKGEIEMYFVENIN